MVSLQFDLSAPEGRYGMMVAVRALEERVNRLFTEGLIHGTAHLCIGQEACAVGAVSAARPDDPIISSHRGHGHFLARTGRPDLLLGELLGKATGACMGRGGSQHLCSRAHHFYGTNGITGGGLPVATGVALSARMEGTGQVVLCFFGDGASNQGTFHESLNMASIWALPIVYVCENNQYAMSTAARDSMRVSSVVERAGSYGMKGLRVDGMDVEAVREAVGEALAAARAGEGPVLVEAECYRFCGHSRSDRLVYRTRQEEERWRLRDPIATARRRLLEQGFAEERLQELEQRARRAVADAYEEALRAPEPTESQVLVSPYAEAVPDE